MVRYSKYHVREMCLNLVFRNLVSKYAYGQKLTPKQHAKQHHNQYNHGLAPKQHQTLLLVICCREFRGCTSCSPPFLPNSRNPVALFCISFPSKLERLHRLRTWIFQRFSGSSNNLPPKVIPHVFLATIGRSPLDFTIAANATRRSLRSNSHCCRSCQSPVRSIAHPTQRPRQQHHDPHKARQSQQTFL